MASLEDLKDVLVSINESLNNQSIVLGEILSLQVKMEKASRPRPDTSVVPEEYSSPVAAPIKKELEGLGLIGQSFGEHLLDAMRGVLLIPTSLIAASTALGLAFAGLRGWEIKLLDNIKDAISSLSKNLLGGLINLKNSVLFYFGFDSAGNVVKNSALDDILKTPIAQKLVSGISKLMYPIVKIGEFIEGVIRGSAGDDITKAVFSFFRRGGSAVGAFAKTVSKILKPIGILFSAYDGVMAFMQKEGNIIDKFAAGIGAFIGDFVGAPLDLLKNIISWGIDKLGFENASSIIDSFSFEELIKDLIGGVYGLLRGAVSWIGTLFTDPSEALTQLWNAQYGKGGLFDIMMAPIDKAVDWITKKFGWRDGDAPNFNTRDIIAGFVNTSSSWIQEKLQSLSLMLSESFNNLVDKLATIPDRIKFAAEEMFIDVADRVQKGFVSFGDWVASIPARLKLLALSAIQSAMTGLPEWAQIVSVEDIAAAQESVNSRSNSSAEKIAEIDANTELKRADLYKRKAESGLYDISSGAVRATEESSIISPIEMQSRMIEEQRRIANFQSQATLLSEASKSQGTVVVDAKQTDARTITNVGGSTNNTTIITPRTSGDLDYGLPRGIQ